MRGDVYKIEAVVTDELEETVSRTQLLDYVREALEDVGFIIESLEVKDHQL